MASSAKLAITNGESPGSCSKLFGYEVCRVDESASNISAGPLSGKRMQIQNMQSHPDAAQLSKANPNIYECSVDEWTQDSAIMGWRFKEGQPGPSLHEYAPQKSMPQPLSAPPTASSQRNLVTLNSENLNSEVKRCSGMLSLNCKAMEQEEANPFSASRDITPVASTRSSYNWSLKKTPNSPGADALPVVDLDEEVGVDRITLGHRCASSCQQANAQCISNEFLCATAAPVSPDAATCSASSSMVISESKCAAGVFGTTPRGGAGFGEGATIA